VPVPKSSIAMRTDAGDLAQQDHARSGSCITSFGISSSRRPRGRVERTRRDIVDQPGVQELARDS